MLYIKTILIHLIETQEFQLICYMEMRYALLFMTCMENKSKLYPMNLNLQENMKFNGMEQTVLAKQYLQVFI